MPSTNAEVASLNSPANCAPARKRDQLTRVDNHVDDVRGRFHPQAFGQIHHTLDHIREVNW